MILQSCFVGLYCISILLLEDTQLTVFDHASLKVALIAHLGFDLGPGGLSFTLRTEGATEAVCHVGDYMDAAD